MANRRRVQVTSGLTPQEFRPAAAPVDRFRQTNAGLKLAQLAEGLAKFNPSLMRFAEVQAERQGIEDKAAGEAAARQWAEDGLTAKQAIEQGLITPDQSEWFRFGADEFLGRNTATRYRDHLRTSLAASEVNDSTELSDFDEFEQATRKAFLENEVGGARSEAFEVGFGRSVDAVLSNERSAFSAAAGERLVKQTYQGVHQRIMSVALDGSTGDMSPENIAPLIKLDIERAIAMGMDKHRVNMTAAEAIINAARQADDEGLLDLLDEIETSKGSILGGISEVAQAREQAFEQIVTGNRIKEQAAQERLDRQKRDSARELGTALTLDLIEQGMSLPGFDQRVAEIAQFDEGYALSFYNARNTVLSGQNVEDPQAIEDLIFGVYSGSTTERSALNAMAAGAIGVNGLNQVMNHIQQVQSKSGGGLGPGRGGINDPAFNTDAYIESERTLLAMYGAKDFQTLEGAGDPAAARRAVGRLRQVWWEAYHTRGLKDSLYPDQADFLSTMVERTHRAFSPGSGAGAVFNTVDAVPGGENSPIWQRQRVLPDRQLGLLGQQLERGSVGQATLMTLYRTYGVEPEDVQRFYDQQRTFPFYQPQR